MQNRLPQTLNDLERRYMDYIAAQQEQQRIQANQAKPYGVARQNLYGLDIGGDIGLNDIKGQFATDPLTRGMAEVLMDVAPVSGEMRSIDRLEEQYNEFQKAQRPFQKARIAAEMGLEGGSTIAGLIPPLKAGGAALGGLFAMMSRKGVPEGIARAPQAARMTGTIGIKNPQFKGALDRQGMLELTHYTNAKDLDVIDPSKYGKAGGLSSRTRSELNRRSDPAFINRSSYGILADDGGYMKESGLGAIEYKAKIDPNKLYDFDNDPLGIMDKTRVIDTQTQATMNEAAIRNAGFSGYYSNHPRFGKVAQVFEPLDVVKPKEMTEIDGRILGQYPTSTAGRIQNKTKTQGGYSVSPSTGTVPTEGIMMGKYSNADPRNVVTDKIPTKAELESYAKLNRKDWEKADHYFGVWRDPDSGNTYLDVSKRYSSDEVRKATKAGERTGQLAGWNLTKGEEIPVGDWDAFINSDEFANRMDEMSEVGQKYLAEHPTGEWWDMHGTSFEDAYGADQLPHVAGYTATTAPNTSPRENLQTMSEYMRREISGEPILQPDWRVPEGTMSRNAGSKLGMESGRAKNLTRTHEGRLNDLSADKVRNEAEAMMGDPNAVVLDRHWARIAEDPINGVFTAVQEGVVPPGKTYEALKDAVAAHAFKQGRDPRDYSADVWTGIRETIKNKAELYGTKFAKGSIQGSSKGYADVFTDLIEEKAKFLNITKNEMMLRLKKGDVNLLSIILATPLGMALYQDSQQGDL